MFEGFHQRADELTFRALPHRYLIELAADIHGRRGHD
jgi:hypothetical protein